MMLVLYTAYLLTDECSNSFVSRINLLLERTYVTSRNRQEWNGSLNLHKDFWCDFCLTTHSKL